MILQNKGDFILWKPGNHHRTQMMMFWRRYNDLFRSVVRVGENPGKEVANSFGSTIYQWGLITLSKFPLEGWIFGAERAKNEPPPCYSKTKSQRSEPKWLWNISSHPTSVPGFSQIGWPQLLAPGTLSQTITLKVVGDWVILFGKKLFSRPNLLM